MRWMLLAVMFAFITFAGRDAESKPEVPAPLEGYWGYLCSSYENELWLMDQQYGSRIIRVVFPPMAEDESREWWDKMAYINYFRGAVSVDRYSRPVLRVYEVIRCDTFCGHIFEQDGKWYLQDIDMLDCSPLELQINQRFDNLIRTLQKLNSPFVEGTSYTSIGGISRVLHMEPIAGYRRSFEVGILHYFEESDTYMLRTGYKDLEVYFINDDQKQWAANHKGLAVKVLGFEQATYGHITTDFSGGVVSKPKLQFEIGDYPTKFVIEKIDVATSITGKLVREISKYYLVMDDGSRIELSATIYIISELQEFDFKSSFTDPFPDFVDQRLKVTGTWNYFFDILADFPDEKSPPDEVDFLVYDLVPTSK